MKRNRHGLTLGSFLEDSGLLGRSEPGSSCPTFQAPAVQASENIRLAWDIVLVQKENSSSRYDRSYVNLLEMLQVEYRVNVEYRDDVEYRE